MDIVNVILIEHGRIKDIESFAVVCPELQNDVVEDAEKHFVTQANKIGMPIEDDAIVESYVEDAYYSNHGHSVSLVWSHSTNE